MNYQKYFSSILSIFILMFVCTSVKAQMFDLKSDFTLQDTLRGSITPERDWWDLTHYQLSVAVDISNRSLSGSNVISYRVLEQDNVMQIDLQQPMEISRATQDGYELPVERIGSAWFVTLKDEQTVGDIYQLTIHFEGTPTVAANPPWSGGITWETDSNGQPFIANSNQGDGASIWWPNKDHPYDEPDSMRIGITAPQDLMAVSNGRLTSKEEHTDGRITWNWQVVNPINNYGVNLSVGDYVHFGEDYEGEAGMLTLDYYVLRENEEKAREHFYGQVKPMMDAFEYWFGPYPFYEDGFKLIEVPYLGMEHQSAVTYGNGYQNGYLGIDRSGSGWGLTFDFIIIHETGHEWFANSITYSDVADMWIHESFTNYSESLYLDYHHGEQAANEYVRGLRAGISNDRPLLGIRGVNYRGSGDMYNKGGNLLHTIRQIVDDDEIWRRTLRGLNQEFRHQTVSSEQVESYIIQRIGIPLDTVFNQYLRDIRIPVFEYFFRNGELQYRWNNVVDGFIMPVDVSIGGKNFRLEVTDEWEAMTWDTELATSLRVDPNYYVGYFNLLGLGDSSGE